MVDPRAPGGKLKRSCELVFLFDVYITLLVLHAVVVIAPR